ncbi:RNA polymerase sigma factor [Tessaracoccus caeni]|uniref:RNA polymerase sigma factor n=1 Tax=Tessaracoccus caeni TaxID=3031239 RepID=UPI0023DC0BE2|nr:SigE family RNA polymerase sigma factor [Tessaracoccus caeni]MDF1487786.1 SigE family RNA polymerase sigma factor [Tessaracoccus caeni]
MNEAQFDAFYTASFSRVVGQIYVMCGNLTEAQDCTQEAFIRAWDHRSQLTASGNPEAWVRTTAYRLAVSRWRKAKRAFRQPDRALETMTATEPSPDRVAVAEALKQLPKDQRRAIVLHHLCDLSVSEVATEVGSPTGTVKARLSRGRAKLAQLLNTDLEARHA